MARFEETANLSEGGDWESLLLLLHLEFLQSNNLVYAQGKHTHMLSSSVQSQTEHNGITYGGNVRQF